MKLTTVSPYVMSSVFIALAAVLVVVSMLYSNSLTSRLAEEEHKKMEMWAAATSQVAKAAPDADIDFAMSVIEGNTTIPVYMTDGEGVYMMSRNVELPAKLRKENANEEEVQSYLQARVDKLREKEEPIVVDVAPGIVQWIFHEDSTLLHRLQYFPYVNLAVVFLFFALSLVSVFTAQRAEQDRVWAGLSKETAHQLGTPISSLNVCAEMLRVQYPNEALIPQIDKDLTRLTTIAERFSKVGSKPEIKPLELQPVLQESIEYMQSRTSNRVEWHMPTDKEWAGLHAMLSPALLGWVVENLLRNAVDAMEGEGCITISVSADADNVLVDVTDTGKGIPKRDQRRVFLPGYTTKERGWGMGLSLCKRIIEDYHKGKIMVLESVVGRGTTFRIRLNKA